MLARLRPAASYACQSSVSSRCSEPATARTASWSRSISCWGVQGGAFGVEGPISWGRKTYWSEWSGLFVPTRSPLPPLATPKPTSSPNDKRPGLETTETAATHRAPL